MSSIPQSALRNSPSRLGVWFFLHERGCLWGLMTLGLLLRFLLIHGAPQPYGYVYDFYHPAVEFFHRTGRLPEVLTVREGYHPPLYYLLGLLFYRVGLLFHHSLLALGLLSMVCGLAVVYYTIRILRLLRQRGLYLVLGAATAWICPCLFISSYGVEADILLTALMTAFLFYLLRYHLWPGRAGARDAALLGVLAGLAMATKYNGMLAPLVAGEVVAVRLLQGPRRLKALREGLLLLALCLALGSWKYVDNYRKYQQPLVGNIIERHEFSLSRGNTNWGNYDFFAFRLGQAVALMKPDAPPGKLTSFPVYNEIWTSLHAQLWTDMSFFSNPTRHGVDAALYPARGVPVALSGTVLALGVLPDLLALLGLSLTIFRRPFWPLALLLATTMVVYLNWVSAQLVWAVKFKYILFLLPVYVVYMLIGLRWVNRRLPRPLPAATTVLLLALVFATHLYLFRFAIGQ